MAQHKIDEYWWAPAIIPAGRKNPMIFEKYIRTTRKRMIEDFIMGSYSGAHDWEYRRKLGWKAVRLRITADF